MKLDLRQLRYVLALERYRNFAKAAAEIGLTQPALSRSLRALEEAVGARLFDRDRTRVEPTAVGARLIELARPLVMQARLAERELEQLLGLAGGLLRIGAGPYASEVSVGTAVARLARQRPDLRAEISISDWPELYRRLLANELDVVVAETSHAMDDSRFAIEPLLSHQAYFYCRAGHPLTTQPDVTLQAIKAFPLAMPLLPHRLLEMVGKSALPQASGALDATATTEFRIDNPMMARRIVSTSDVVSAAVPVQIEQDVMLGRLTILPPAFPWLKTSYGILRLASRTPSPAAAEFLQILRQVELEVDAGSGAERRMAAQ